MYTYRLAQSEQEIVGCYPIVYQFPPHLTESEFVEQVLPEGKLRYSQPSLLQEALITYG